MWFIKKIKKIIDCLNDNKTKKEFEDDSYFDKINNELSSFKIFTFSKKELENIIKSDNKIKNIYNYLFEYTLTWEFVNKNELQIIKSIENLKEKFLNKNIEPEGKEFEKFINSIDTLIQDIKELNNFKLKNKYKRDRLIDTWEQVIHNSIILDERWLFKILLSLNVISFYFEYFHTSLRDIHTILISFYEDLNKNDIWNKRQIIILKGIVEFLLYKVSLIYKKNKISYLNGQELKDINIEKVINQWIFKKHREILSFLCNSTKSYTIDNTYKKFKNKDKITNLEQLILIKYHKNIWKNSSVLKEIFNQKYNADKNSLNENINAIYIGNNLLSLLVSQFQEISKEDNQEYIQEIDKLYSKLTDLHKKINQNYNNHFSYLKYAQFKNLQYILGNNLHKNWTLNFCEKALEKAKKELNKLNYNCFYEFEFEDNLLEIEIQEGRTEKIYLHNIFYFPFDIKAQQDKIILEQNNLFQNKVDFKFYNKFANVEEKIDSHKLDAIAIIGIFTGIVVYSIGTIQIFTIIEDLWSAIMFAWIFLSWILFLLWWIYYKQWYCFNLKENKWLNLFLIAMALLIITFLWKHYFSWITLNTNKANNTNDSLKTNIQQAESLNKMLEDKIKLLNINADK